MPEVTKEMVVQALSKVNDPELHRDLISLGMIRNIAVSDGAVKFTLALTTMACPLKGKMQEDCKTAVMRIPGVREVTIDLTADTPRNARPSSGKKVGDIVLQDMLPTVKNAIAVASGKGGVGKSTVSVNIAAALAMEGSRVGLLDADIYGPSIPIMMGVTEQPEITDSEEIIPITKFGIELMSIGFVIPEEQSVIWRGPMVAKMLQQFLSGVKWGELDYLIVDLPPGTGDAQLTLTQSVPLAGGLIVSTPQAVALADVRRGITMFKKVDVPILGVVENMSTFVCPRCGHEEHIFAYGGARSEAEKLGVPFLGEIPIDLSIREGGDSGVPVVVAHPDSPVGLAFRKLARDAAAAVSVSNLTARKAERREPAKTGKELPMMK